VDFSMKENGFSTELGYGELKISAQEEAGYRPYALLVSSIVGCSGGVLRKVLERMRVPFEDIKISANVSRNEEVANRIEEIQLFFTIYGENIESTKVHKALKLTRKNCGMIQSVQDSIKITEDFEIKHQ